MRILFIGNSHTYVNVVPEIVKELFAEVGVKVYYTMLVEGGKCLDYHADRKETGLNIVKGEYDYVILQGKATGFDPEAFIAGGRKIIGEYVSVSGAKPVLYLVWALRGHSEDQIPMTAAYRTLAEETGALIAPAGEVWHQILRRRPAPVLYRDDGNHATETGSYLAACCIFYALSDRARALRVAEGGQPHTRLGIDTKTAAAIQTAACRMTRSINGKDEADQ